MVGTVEFDPNDPTWREIAEILDKKPPRVIECPQCGGRAIAHYVHKRYENIDLEMARERWYCEDCERHGQSLTYWRRYGDRAPNRWRVRATQANFKEILLELRRYPFWKKLFEDGKPVLFAHRMIDGKPYVSFHEIVDFLDKAIGDHLYLDDDSDLWPSWATSEDIIE